MTDLLSTTSTKCPVCLKANNIRKCFELPQYPITEKFKANADMSPIEEVLFADQAFLYCQSCNHGFLRNVISPKYLYSKENYFTATSKSSGSILCINNFSSFILRYRERVAFTIDVGGNDSDLINEIGCTEGVIIDPNAKSTNPRVKCISSFVHEIDPSCFNENEIDILSSHTLEHIEDPHSFFSFAVGIKGLQNVFIQMPCLESMVESARYDLVHHQHVHYFSLMSLSILAREYGFKVNSHEYDVDHYGTLRVHLIKEKNISMQSASISGLEILGSDIGCDYGSFSEVTCKQNDLLDRLSGIFCYGASLMLPIVYYYHPVLNQLAIGILDSNKDKSSIRYLNVSTPILYDDAKDLTNKVVVVSAVATRVACRRIISSLIDRNAQYIIVPFASF